MLHVQFVRVLLFQDTPSMKKVPLQTPLYVIHLFPSKSAEGDRGRCSPILKNSLPSLDNSLHFETSICKTVVICSAVPVWLNVERIRLLLTFTRFQKRAEKKHTGGALQRVFFRTISRRKITMTMQWDRKPFHSDIFTIHFLSVFTLRGILRNTWNGNTLRNCATSGL